MTYLYIFIGGGLGSLARFLTSKLSHQIFTTSFPIGTFISNIIACSLLALIVVFFSNKQNEYDWIQPLLLIGFRGGYSTFSTFSNETYDLLTNGEVAVGIANILISVIVGIGLIFLIRSKV